MVPSHFSRFTFGDVENEHRSRRPPDDGLDAAILCILKDNPHATAHKMARKLGVDPSTIARHLNNYIGMKWLHLRYVLNESESTVCRYLTLYLHKKYMHTKWIPHSLTNPQKM